MKIGFTSEERGVRHREELSVRFAEATMTRRMFAL